jgi:methyl-accepting chemotaxis protein
MNCWEYMRCPEKRKNNCEVFLYSYGKECWNIPKELSYHQGKSTASCLTCPWYIKNYRENKT